MHYFSGKGCSEFLESMHYCIGILNSSFPYNDVIPKLLHHAEQIMSFLGTNGLTRVDYRIKNAEEYYVFDIAALPVLANTGTCMQSFKYLFDNQNSLFKAIIGSTLFQH